MLFQIISHSDQIAEGAIIHKTLQQIRLQTKKHESKQKLRILLYYWNIIQNSGYF
jgi:hypothetical protein